MRFKSCTFDVAICIHFFLCLTHCVAGFLTRIKPPPFPLQNHQYSHRSHPSKSLQQTTAVITRIRTNKERLSETAAAAATIVQEELLEGENALFLRGETPITTLTWFQGDPQMAATILQDRLKLIMDQNRWLAGRITSTSNKALLNFDPSKAVDVVEDGHFKALLPHESPVRRRTPLDRLASNCKKLLLSNGPNEPLFQVTVVPCRSSPTTQFAVIVALSHIVGDGHTYYKILSMLCSGKDNNDNVDVVEPLIYQRISTTAKQQAAAMGQSNYDFFARPGPAFFLNYLGGLVKARTFGPVNQCIFAMVDDDGMQQEKMRYTSKSDIGNNAQEIDFVSTNDVLTSWFLKTTQSDVGAMAINFRNRLPYHTDRHAGNYESIIVYAPPDYASPALIRKSLETFRRTKTINDALPNFFESLGLSSGLVTNWSSFAQPNLIPNCQEELHIPLYDAVPLVPNGTAVMIIFRAGPTQGLGLFMAGAPDVLRELGYSRQFQIQKPGFLSARPLR